MFKSFSKIIAVVLFATIIVSCKKDRSIEKDVKPTPTNNRTELTKDSIFLYAKEVYLWNKLLPSYSSFNPRGFTASSTDLGNFENELFALTKYAINPLTNRPYEYYDNNEPKYSYIYDLVARGQLSYAPFSKASIDLNGQGNDLGYSIVPISTGVANNYLIYFEYTSPGSPSYLAGLRRGDYINEVNGTKIGVNYNTEVDFLRSVFNSDPSTISFAGKRKNGTTFNVTLTKTTYTSNPVLKDSIYTENGKVIGYLAYARFSNLANSQNVLDQVFSKFATAGVTNLVIDLRYNGGGYVQTAEKLVNLIAPSSIDNKLMFTEYYNSTMQKNEATILKNQLLLDDDGNPQYRNGTLLTYFNFATNPYTPANNRAYISKNVKGELTSSNQLTNVNKVVFIIGENTASASELVINSLQAYNSNIEVKTVGETSYGKPIGFFPIRIDKYDVYYSMFETKNALDKGQYYAGITPDNDTDYDDVLDDFGDKNELALATAINYLSTGTFTLPRTSSAKISSTSQVKTTTVQSLGKGSLNPDNSFKGMVEKPGRFK